MLHRSFQLCSMLTFLLSVVLVCAYALKFAKMSSKLQEGIGMMPRLKRSNNEYAKKMADAKFSSLNSIRKASSGTQDVLEARKSHLVQTADCVLLNQKKFFADCFRSRTEKTGMWSPWKMFHALIGEKNPPSLNGNFVFSNELNKEGLNPRHSPAMPFKEVLQSLENTLPVQMHFTKEKKLDTIDLSVSVVGACEFKVGKNDHFRYIATLYPSSKVTRSFPLDELYKSFDGRTDYNVKYLGDDVIPGDGLLWIKFRTDSLQGDFSVMFPFENSEGIQHETRYFKSAVFINPETPKLTEIGQALPVCLADEELEAHPELRPFFTPTSSYGEWFLSPRETWNIIRRDIYDTGDDEDPPSEVMQVWNQEKYREGQKATEEDLKDYKELFSKGRGYDYLIQKKKVMLDGKNTGLDYEDYEYVKEYAENIKPFRSSYKEGF